ATCALQDDEGLRAGLPFCDERRARGARLDDRSLREQPELALRTLGEQRYRREMPVHVGGLRRPDRPELVRLLQGYLVELMREHATPLGPTGASEVGSSTVNHGAGR